MPAIRDLGKKNPDIFACVTHCSHDLPRGHFSVQMPTSNTGAISDCTVSEKFSNLRLRCAGLKQTGVNQIK